MIQNPTEEPGHVQVDVATRHAFSSPPFLRGGGTLKTVVVTGKFRTLRISWNVPGS